MTIKYGLLKCQLKQLHFGHTARASLCRRKAGLFKCSSNNHMFELRFFHFTRTSRLQWQRIPYASKGLTTPFPVWYVHLLFDCFEFLYWLHYCFPLLVRYLSYEGIFSSSRKDFAQTSTILYGSKKKSQHPFTG
jgi:hypothetical protein